MKPLKVDFTSNAFSLDPRPTLTGLRRQGEVVRIKLPLLGAVWMTVSHAATSDMLKNNQLFTMRKPARKGHQKGDVTGMQWWMPRGIRLLSDNMLSNDEPDHRRLRKLVDQAFQRLSVMNMEASIDSLAKELADRLKVEPESRSVDLVEGFARRLPMTVICHLLGLSEPETEAFAKQAARLTNVSGIVSFLGAMIPIRRMRIMLETIVEAEHKRQAAGHAGTGLIAELVQAESDGDTLSHDELIAMIFLLLVAGHETTTHLISGSVLTLLQHPRQKEWLFEDEGRMDMAVEELLRFVSPVQFSKPRIVRNSGEFHGASLQAGDSIIACLAAANMDPQRFENPGRLDLERRPNPHLEFGTGIHFCLGFQLARLELKRALIALFEAFPNMELAPHGAEYSQRMGMRALKRLQVYPELAS